MTASVAPDYVHRDKVITPGEGLAVNGVRLKWYDIALADTPVPAEIAAMARAFVRDLDLPGELGLKSSIFRSSVAQSTMWRRNHLPANSGRAMAASAT